MNQIKQIIEKYKRDYGYTPPLGMDIVITAISPKNLPALEADLSAAMQEQAVKFAEWASNNDYWYSKMWDEWRNRSAQKPASKASLYTRFLFEQWAEREGYTKVIGGWNVPGSNELGLPMNESELMEQFKKQL